MISYIIPRPPVEDTGAAHDRVRMEQRFNSMSAQNLEKLFSRPEFRSGLIRFTMNRPEHKLRDLARNVLGQSEEQLGELAIEQVAKLFYDRRMTFTFDQIANIAFRRYREHAVARLLGNYEDETEENGKTLFLVHDQSGSVSLVTMENKHDFFPCFVTPVAEGPLFENAATAFVLRHPNPNLIWKVSLPHPEGLFAQYSRHNIGVCDTPRIEEIADFDWSFGCIEQGFGPWPAGTAFQKKILSAYKMQNLDVKVGFGIYSPDEWREGKDPRTLFGFPKDGPRPDPKAVQANIWMAEIMGMIAQMCDGDDMPRPIDFVALSVRHTKVEWIRACGLTFSAREVGLFLRNAPRPDDYQKNVLLAHDDAGQVFLVTISYKDQKISHVSLSRADMHGELVGWTSNVRFCLRTHAMDGIVLISPPVLMHHSGSYEAVWPSRRH